MRTLSANLQTHIAQEVTSLATCWKLTRKDGTVLAFTDHDVDLLVGGTTYKAATGYTASNIRGSSDFSVDNLEVVGLLDSAEITEQDIVAGLYDDATVEIFSVNHLSIADGQIDLRKGHIGEVSLGRTSFVAELRGLMQRLQQQVGELHSPLCRAELGDGRCQVNLVPFTVNGTVTGVTDNRQFADNTRGSGPEVDDWFNFGLLTWTSGDNNGLSKEVKDFVSAAGEFTLYEVMPFDVQIGDGYTVFAGCDKRLSTCKDKFNNVVNFRGEPYIPGADEAIRYVVPR